MFKNFLLNVGKIYLVVSLGLFLASNVQAGGKNKKVSTVILDSSPEIVPAASASAASAAACPVQAWICAPRPDSSLRSEVEIRMAVGMEKMERRGELTEEEQSQYFRLARFYFYGSPSAAGGVVKTDSKKAVQLLMYVTANSKSGKAWTYLGNIYLYNDMTYDDNAPRPQGFVRFNPSDGVRALAAKCFKKAATADAKQNESKNGPQILDLLAPPGEAKQDQVEFDIDGKAPKAESDSVDISDLKCDLFSFTSVEDQCGSK